jgi:hypothetical protein
MQREVEEESPFPSNYSHVDNLVFIVHSYSITDKILYPKTTTTAINSRIY